MITTGSPPGKEQVKHLLVVEDEALIAMDETTLLEKQGYRVTTVHSGAEAVERAEQQDIDLILIDIDLGKGKMDGVEAAEIILRNRDFPVVFLSNHTEPEIVERTEKITSYGYVIKSSGETVLLNVVKMALRLRDAGKEKAERELRIGAEKFKALYDNSPLPYQSLDESGAFIDVNPAWLKALGYTREEVIGKNFSEVLHPDWAPHFKKNFPEFKRRGSISNVEFRMCRKDGSSLDAAFEGRAGYNPDGSFRQTYCVFQDITAQKQARVSLQQTRNWYDTLVQSSMDGFWRVSADGRLLEVNDTYCRMSGYSREELIGMPASRLEAVENQEEVARHVQMVIEKGGDRFESAHRRKDGTLFDIEVVSTYVPLEPVQLLSFIRDITEAKKAREELEESEAILKEAQEIAELGSYVWNLVTDELRWSKNMYTIAGLDPEGFYGNLNETIAKAVHRDDQEEVNRQVNVMVEQKRTWPMDFRLVRPDGDIRWVQSRARFFFDAAGNPVRAIGVHYDITDRRKAEQKLIKTLDEKEILLQEMNHRIKNNLLMVESLIHLKQKAAGDTVDLSDIEHRIDTIRILHEKLYKTGDVSWIDLKAYLGDIADSVFSTLSGDHIECVNEIEHCRVETKSAVALGLITNELASNTIKHAHTEDKRVIWFKLSLDTKTSPNTCTLTVTNNGPPFPGEVNPAAPKTLGMRLVTLLVEQLGGGLTIIRVPHPVFEICFPRDHLVKKDERHG